jgi:hypothetical protein
MTSHRFSTVSLSGLVRLSARAPAGTRTSSVPVAVALPVYFATHHGWTAPRCSR